VLDRCGGCRAARAAAAEYDGDEDDLMNEPVGGHFLIFHAAAVRSCPHRGLVPSMRWALALYFTSEGYT
jgi:hypothetical protein